MKKKSKKPNGVNADGEAYLTKRVLERAIKKGTKGIADKVMASREYIVTARDGWVVKVYADGRVEKLEKI